MDFSPFLERALSGRRLLLLQTQKQSHQHFTNDSSGVSNAPLCQPLLFLRVGVARGGLANLCGVPGPSKTVPCNARHGVCIVSEASSLYTLGVSKAAFIRHDSMPAWPLWHAWPA